MLLCAQCLFSMWRTGTSSKSLNRRLQVRHFMICHAHCILALSLVNCTFKFRCLNLVCCNICTISISDWSEKWPEDVFFFFFYRLCDIHSIKVTWWHTEMFQIKQNSVFKLFWIADYISASLFTANGNCRWLGLSNWVDWKCREINSHHPMKRKTHLRSLSVEYVITIAVWR